MGRTHTFTSAALGLAALLSGTPALSAEPATRAALGRTALAGIGARGAEIDAAQPCGLVRPGSETATTADCLACHGGSGPGVQLHTSHPVDIDYERARYRPNSSLRPMAEAVKRGVFLPEGQLRCLTCHDARSPWRYRLALPPGAPVKSAVRPGDPRTYDPARASERPVPHPDASLPAADRDASPTPLCKLCHTYGE
ncbi:MAG: hypothetical protein HZB56_23190 [Deltaproteobacteria bacterium]|nr:hypothetical protein [Deltaproteobacteria bacterium]